MDNSPKRSDQGAKSAGVSQGTRPVSRPAPGPPGSRPPETGNADHDRRLRRARFLAELTEARELRKRVAPRRARTAEFHARLLRTFRY